MQIAEIMIPDPRCLSVHSSIGEAAQLFMELGIDGAPVIREDGSIIGVLDKTGLYRAMAEGLEWSASIEKVITKDIVTVDADDNVFDLINLPYSNLLVTRNGQIMGMAAKADLLAASNKVLQDIAGELETVMDSAHNAIVSIDSDEKIRTFNLAAQKLFKYPKEDVIGQPYYDFFPQGNLSQVLKNGKIMTGQKVKFKDINLICDYAPIITENKITGAVSVSQDISEIENMTKEFKDEMNAVIEASFDSFFVTDAEARVLSVNEAYTRITGIKAEEVLGKTMYELIERGYYDKSATIEVIKTKKTVTFTQTIKNGRTMLVTGNPIFNKKGELVRVLTNGRDITELNSLKQEVEQANELNLHYQRELQKYRSPEQYVVKSDKLQDIFDLVYRLSKVDSTVLIQGESGVGKEIIANELHRSSLRSDKPMIRVNCAAIPENLLESELFGYEPGAFTGAKKEGKMGIFELANMGTLFLDEIGELTVPLQVKLLRVIQEGEVRRLGSTKSIKVDVRLITASNRDIWDMVEKKQFRKDLFYRLNVVPIIIPPLRERKEEIPALVAHFTKIFNERYGLERKIDHHLIKNLMEYDWPGNIRELKNVVERAIVTSQDDMVKDIKLYEMHDIHSSLSTFKVEFGSNLKEALESLEKEILEKSIKEYGSSRKVARALGVSQTSIVRKAARYGIVLQS